MTAPDRVVVLDKFTYAGNIENLRPVLDDERLRVVEGDILDRPPRRPADGRGRRGGALRGGEPRRPLDPRRRRLRDDQRRRHPDPARLRALERGSSRFVHVSTDEVYGSIEEGSWDEEQPLEPNSPYSASKASSDLLARAYHRTHGLPVYDHPVLQQLRALPVPREGHPAVRHQPDRRRRRAAVRRGRQRARLAARRRPLPRASTWCSRAAVPARSTTSAAAPS